ncbi:hypothetical protein BGZ75_009841 [Mortierella antarctica]|nr:hypothetical protein BGZ75_009841 [Mortierella antarctica]
MSSSIELPAIQTKFASFTSSSSSASRPYRPASPSPSSPSPVMAYQPTRSYSITPSLSSRGSNSSLHSLYSSSSERSMSCSPGPSTPCDGVSRSPSFSHAERKHLMNIPHKLPMPASPFSPAQQRYPSHHYPYQQQPQQTSHHYSHHSASVPHPSTGKQYYAQGMTSPRDLYPSSPSVPSRDHLEYHHQRDSHYHSRGDRSPYGSGPGDYFSRAPTASSSHHHLATPMTPSAMDQAPSRVHPHSPAPAHAPMTPLQVSTRSVHSTPYHSPPTSGRRLTIEEDYSSSMRPSRSPSVSSDHSLFSRESSPFPSASEIHHQQHYPAHHHHHHHHHHQGRGGLVSPASTSMTSLSESVYANSNSSSSSLVSPSMPSSAAGGPSTATSPQLLLCPVCSRAFKPSKNQNCNLRRHLKNVHNMSPTMHPRKCKWDSLPDGRVKDDKDRKERTRKSKRLWARKFRQRRKVEEAAVVLSMLSQAV